MIIFDFDGVMTDNRVLVDQEGREAVFVSRADGMGVNMIRKANIPMVILSTESNPVVSARAKKLNLHVLQGVEDKRERMCKYCALNHIELEDVLYVGNDINDYEAMLCVGMRVVPADAYDEVKKIADIILNTKGGYGVVRELASLLLKETSEDGK